MYRESEEEDDDLLEEDGENEVQTARKSSRRPRSSRNFKSANGKRGVNMTPPDRLLHSALKKAYKFGEAGKVR